MENLETRKKSKSFSNKKQLTKLISLMENNPSIAKGICKRKEADEKWKEFSKELNLMGPPIKTCEKWNRVWIDLKCKVKKKLIQNKKKIRSTGGVPNNFNYLSAMDEKVVKFLSLDLCVNPPRKEVGEKLVETFEKELPVVINQETAVNEDTVLSQETNVENQNIPSRKINIFHKRRDLEKHAKDFEQLNEYNRITAEYTKKLYYLKKETYHELLQIKKDKLETYKKEVKIKQQMLRSLKRLLVLSEYDISFR